MGSTGFLLWTKQASQCLRAQWLRNQRSTGRVFLQLWKKYHPPTHYFFKLEKVRIYNQGFGYGTIRI